jgi:hypothetical protein
MKNMAPMDHGSLMIRRIPTRRRKHSLLHKRRRRSLLNGTSTMVLSSLKPRTKTTGCV